jgi:hypothetical protein
MRASEAQVTLKNRTAQINGNCNYMSSGDGNE